MRSHKALTVVMALALGFTLMVFGSHNAPGGASLPIAIAGTMPPDQTSDNATPAPDQSTPAQAAAPTATVAAAATPAPSGTILASDNFSNPDAGLLPKAPPAASADTWKVGYVGGEYQITSIKPVVAANYTALVMGTYSDVVVAADAHLTAAADSADWVGVGCRFRATPTGPNGYYLHFIPSSNAYHLYRLDAGTQVDFTGLGQTLSITASQTGTHHLQISCSGSTITGSVDGVQIGSVQDSGYKTGTAVIRAGSASFTNAQTGVAVGSYAVIVDARFANLVLTQP